MGLLIGITGGNHILHRSLIEACEKAGHQPVILDSGSRPGPASPRAQLEPASTPQSAGAFDVTIVIDPSLVPRTTSDSATAEKTGAATFETRRTVFATSFEGSSEAAPNHSPSAENTLIVRATPVYGIATDPVTLFLIMMRSLPAVPVLTGARPIELIWQEDLAAALVAAAAMPAPGLPVIDVAGPEAVTADELYERLGALIDRRPVRVPVPDFLARYASRATELLGLSGSIEPILDAFPAKRAAPANNALAQLIGGSPTRLDAGLRRLIQCLDEVTPAQGVGSVQVKRFHADIAGSRLAPAALLGVFRERFAEIMPTPVGVEPAAPAKRLEDGAVVTIALPGRGHVEVRVKEATADHVIVATLRGHAVAGIVRFSATRAEDAVRFEVTTCDAAANALDWLTLSLGAGRIQDANWTRVVTKVVELSGGQSDGVETAIRTLSAAEAEQAELWIRDIIGSGTLSTRP